MIPPKSLLVRHGKWLQRKRNFVLSCTLALGGFMWVAFLWKFWDFIDSVAATVLILMICLLGAVVWSWLMWHFFQHRAPRWRSDANGNLPDANVSNDVASPNLSSSGRAKSARRSTER